MTVKEVIQLLMKSPFYFRLSLSQRRQMVNEFCKLYATAEQGQASIVKTISSLP